LFIKSLGKTLFWYDQTISKAEYLCNIVSKEFGEDIFVGQNSLWKISGFGVFRDTLARKSHRLRNANQTWEQHAEADKNWLLG
jgi:hypothetical protein